MTNIINELNDNNSTNYKIEVLEKYKDNTFLQRLLKMTYDKVAFTYGITMKNIDYLPESQIDDPSKIPTLESCLDWMEKELCSRNITGNQALEQMETFLGMLNKDDALIIEKVLGRDLKINMGRSNINKVFPKLIIKPVYNRCDIYTIDKELEVEDKKIIKSLIKDTEKEIDRKLTDAEILEIKEKTPPTTKIDKGTALNINFDEGAVVQLKSDGTYREISKIAGNTTSISRSGELYSYPAIENALKDMNDGYLTGELTVKLTDDLLDRILPKLEKADLKNDTKNVETIKRQYKEHQDSSRDYILSRSIGNGLINSDDVPYDNLIFDVWDYITPEDYQLAGLKDKKNPPKIKYKERFERLKEIINDINLPNIRLVDYKIVHSLKEATDYTTKVMNMGLEGAILKDFDMLFKDGTSNNALKLKIKIDAEVRCVGFVEGAPGTKREKTFGSLLYENDEGTIKGSVSGFTDELLELINSDRESYIGRVFTVEFNDITKGRENSHHAFSHPRFITFRDDKGSTDTLNRCFRMKEMAMNFFDTEDELNIYLNSMEMEIESVSLS